MKMNNSLVGKRIGQLRKRRGLSQLMLSEMIDRSPTHLSYIETGAKSMSLGGKPLTLSLRDVLNAPSVYRISSLIHHSNSLLFE